MTNLFLDAALQYAGRGWRCFPCKPRDKLPLTKHGHKDATVKPSIIEAWWAKWPDANVAIATGTVSGLMVLDLDGPEALIRATFLMRSTGRSLNWFTAQDDNTIVTPAVKTGRGFHFYFALEPSEVVKSNAGTGLEKGIDCRSDGGYVIAPPSIHPNGQTYAWIDVRAFPELAQLFDLPRHAV